jgi:hypothetical protein
MAKVTKLRFREEAVGELIDFTAAVSVNQSGEFSAAIPDYLSGIARQRAKNASGIKVNNPRLKNYLVYGKTLESIKTFIGQCVEQYAQGVEKSELVIVYRIVYDYAVAIQDGTGEYHPNGGFCPGAGSTFDGKWFGNLHSTNTRDGFRLAIGAKAFSKITITRGDFSEHRYERADTSVACPDSTPIERLNGFHSLRIDPTADGAREMPYSDEAAEFFTRCLLALARLCKEIEDRFATPESIALMIAGMGQTMNLLGVQSDGN